MKQLISLGSEFEAQIAYSRALVLDNWVFVSGTTGFDYTTMSIAPDIAAQTEQCIKNIENALAQTGATLSDIVRIRYIVPQADEFKECWHLLRQFLGNIKPAATMISAQLIDPRIKIEIEVTSIKTCAS